MAAEASSAEDAPGVDDDAAEAESRRRRSFALQEVVGWCWLGFGEGARAAERFERAEALVEEGETASANLLAGLAAARWQAGEETAAIATYLDISELPEDEQGSYLGTEPLKWPVSGPAPGTKPEDDPLTAVRTAVQAQLNKKMSDFSADQSRPTADATDPEITMGTDAETESALSPESPSSATPGPESSEEM